MPITRFLFIVCRSHPYLHPPVGLLSYTRQVITTNYAIKKRLSQSLWQNRNQSELRLFLTKSIKMVPKMDALFLEFLYFIKRLQELIHWLQMAGQYLIYVIKTPNVQQRIVFSFMYSMNWSKKIKWLFLKFDWCGRFFGYLALSILQVISKITWSHTFFIHQLLQYEKIIRVFKYNLLLAY